MYILYVIYIICIYIYIYIKCPGLIIKFLYDSMYTHIYIIYACICTGTHIYSMYIYIFLFYVQFAEYVKNKLLNVYMIRCIYILCIYMYIFIHILCINILYSSLLSTIRGIFMSSRVALNRPSIVYTYIYMNILYKYIYIL